jgi:hypothetical protein
MVGGTHDTVTEVEAAVLTVIANAGSDAETLPSLTLITMLEKVPVTPGVP